MTNTIFDLVDMTPSSDKEGFFQIADRAPQPKSNSFLDDIADYAKTFLKGSTEGISRLGRMMGPTGDISGYREKERQEEQSETLDELLPTDEGFTQKSLRRGLREAPSMLAFPGSKLATLPRSIAAGFAGQGAEDLGAPEWAQAAAELTAFISPDLTRKLLSSGSNKEIIDAARKLGMSDEALTPLLQSDFKQKWLSKLVPRRGKTESILRNTKKELGETYAKIQGSEEAAGKLSNEGSIKLINTIEDKLVKMPSSVRKKITTDLKDLINAPLTGENLINFYVDVNHATGQKSKQLSLLKEPIKDALKEISPSLAKDLDTVNSLYSKYFPIAKRLKPNIASDIVKAAETLGLLSSFAFGYYPGMLTIAGEKVVKKLSQKLLLSPHFQQLSGKMVVAMNENKYGLAKRISEQMINEIRKISPETADRLEQVNEEDLNKFFNHQKI